MGLWTREPYTNKLSLNNASGSDTNGTFVQPGDSVWDTATVTPTSSTLFAKSGTRSIRVIGAGAATDAYMLEDGDFSLPAKIHPWIAGGTTATEAGNPPMVVGGGYA